MSYKYKWGEVFSLQQIHDQINEMKDLHLWHMCVIQDGSTYVDFFFQVKVDIDLKTWKSQKSYF